MAFQLQQKDFDIATALSGNDITLGNNTVTNFSYITSLEITSENKEAIVNLGRQRWKIENKGFKEQKSDV